MSEFDRNIRLSNGAQHPLGEVSSHLGLLDTLVGDSATRQLVYDLRQCCFGLDPAPERFDRLVEWGLVAKDGAVSPVLKDVVFSAVRGEGTGVYLASPFTDAWDRSLHELRSARTTLYSRLPEAEAHALLTDDPVQRALKGIQGQSPLWRDLVRRPSPPTNPPDFPE